MNAKLSSNCGSFIISFSSFNLIWWTKYRSLNHFHQECSFFMVHFHRSKTPLKALPWNYYGSLDLLILPGNISHYFSYKVVEWYVLIIFHLEMISWELHRRIFYIKIDVKSLFNNSILDCGIWFYVQHLFHFVGVVDNVPTADLWHFASTSVQISRFWVLSWSQVYSFKWLGHSSHWKLWRSENLFVDSPNQFYWRVCSLMEHQLLICLVLCCLELCNSHMPCLFSVQVHWHSDAEHIKAQSMTHDCASIFVDVAI